MAVQYLGTVFAILQHIEKQKYDDEEEVKILDKYGLVENKLYHNNKKSGVSFFLTHARTQRMYHATDQIYHDFDISIALMLLCWVNSILDFVT